MQDSFYFVVVSGLDQVMIEPRLLRLFAVTGLAITCQSDQHDGLAPALLANPFGHFETSKPWQPDIQQHDVRAPRHGDLYCVQAVVHQSHLMTRHAEEIAKALGRVYVVIYNQYPTTLSVRRGGFN